MEDPLMILAASSPFIMGLIGWGIKEKIKKIDLISHNEFKIASLKDQISELKKIIEEKFSQSQQMNAERYAEIKMFISENRKMREDFILVKNETGTQWSKIDEISRELRELKEISSIRNKDI